MNNEDPYYVPESTSKLSPDQIYRLLRNSLDIYNLYGERSIIPEQIKAIVNNALEYVEDNIEFVDKKNNEFEAKEILERDPENVVDAKDTIEKLELIQLGIDDLRKQGEENLWKRYGEGFLAVYEEERIDREKIHSDWNYFYGKVIKPYIKRTKELTVEYLEEKSKPLYLRNPEILEESKKSYDAYYRGLKRLKNLWKRNMALRWWSAKANELKENISDTPTYGSRVGSGYHTDDWNRGNPIPVDNVMKYI